MEGNRRAKLHSVSVRRGYRRMGFFVLAFLVAISVFSPMILSSVQVSAAEVSAGDIFSPDMGNWGTQNNNGWSYMYKKDGAYTELFYHAGTGPWGKDYFRQENVTEMVFIDQVKAYTGENGGMPAYAFKAPIGGNVELFFENHGNSVMRIEIFKNGDLVTGVEEGKDYVSFNTTGVEGNDHTPHTIALEVKKGTMLYIVVSSTDRNVAPEGYVRNYGVKYISTNDDEEPSPPPTYQPDMTQWGAQNNNGWSYMYKLGNMYSRLNYYDSSAEINWQRNNYAVDPSAVGQMMFISQASAFVGEGGGKPTYAFKAPVGGQVELFFENHGNSVMRAEIYKNGDLVPGVEGSNDYISFNTNDYTKHTVTLDVKKDTMLYVVVSSADQSVTREGYVRNYGVKYLSTNEEVEPPPLGNVPQIDPVSDKQIGTTDSIAWFESDYKLVHQYGSLTMPMSGNKNYVGVKDANNTAIWNGATRVTSDFQESQAVINHDLSGSGSVETTVEANTDGTMSVFQKVNRTDSKGISSVAFSLQASMNYDVIIPAWGGIRLSAETPDIDLKYTHLPYPREWGAQMFIIQGDNGGLLVYAVDNGTQFKALNVTNDGTNFNLCMETVPQAPFDVYDEFSTVEWKLVPYKGNWVVGANIYREFADAAFEMPAIEENKPEWAKQVQFVVATDIVEKQEIAELAKKVDPAKTLLEIGGWRKYEYDTHYPDYTPKEGLKALVDYAHSLGFRVSVHYNMIGAALDSPEYTSFLKDSHSLDAFTKEPIIEGYSAFGKDFYFAQLNQASPEWRELLVQKAKETVEELGIDGIHLDQSLICFNDGRGLVDGMTSMQGNVQLQKELAEALPGIAFSGEGINELNLRYSSWLQQHVYGLNNVEQTWDNARFDQIVPLLSVVFGDYTKLWQYPAFPITADEEYFQAWWRAGVHRMGIIPVLMRESAASIKNANATMEMVLDEAKWYQDNQPKINKDPAAWEEGVMLSLTYGDGKTAAYKKDQFGEVFLPDTSKPEEEMVRFISGVSNIKLPGSIREWKYYDAEFIKGLDPTESYLYNATLRDLEATHITTAPENTTIRSWYGEANSTVIEMKEIEDSSNHIVDFMKYAGPMRAGEILDTGEEHVLPEEFGTINAFWYTMESRGEVRHMGDRLFMHPPWMDDVSRLGFTWVEIDVPIEKVGNAVFEAGVQMASSEAARASDGVVFKFYIWEKGDEAKTGMLTHEVHATTASPTPVSFDIAQFEGKTITIRIECDPYKMTYYDSAVIVGPRVIQRISTAEKEVEYTVYSAKEITKIMSSSNKAIITPLGEGLYNINTDLNDTVYLIHGTKVNPLSIDLSLQPYVSNWVYDTGDVTKPVSDLAPVFQVAENHRVLRHGLFAYPPARGKSENTWLLTLPKSGSPDIGGYIGLKKGSDSSQGVTFEVLVNGESIWSEKITPDQSWQRFSVPLSKYRGQTILLTLVTNADGSNEGDQAFWAELFVE